MLALRSTSVRPTAVRSARATPVARRSVVMRAETPKTNIDAEMAKALKAAENCETTGVSPLALAQGASTTLDKVSVTGQLRSFSKHSG